MTKILSFIVTSGLLRAGISQIAMQTSSLPIIETMLGKGRKVWLYLSFVIVKALLLSWLAIQYPSSDTGISAIAAVSADALGAAVTCLLFFYTFRVEPVKGFLCIAVTELLMMIISYPSFIIINTMEKKSELFLIYAEFQPLDLLFFVIIPAFTAILYFIFRKVLLLFRKLEIRHRHIGMAFCLIYFALMQLFTVKTQIFSSRGAILADSLWLFVLLFIILGYRREANLQRAAVYTQLNLMQSQYHAMQNQMVRMDECRKMIDEQMQELSELEQSHSSDVTAKTSEYIRELRSVYKELHSGIYCSDWRLDSVLYTQVTQAQQKGYQVFCEVTGFPSEEKEIDLLIRILLQLFELLFHYEEARISADYEELNMKITQALGQQVILFTCSAPKPGLKFKRNLKHLVKKYNGTVEFRRIDEMSEITVTFECSL